MTGNDLLHLADLVSDDEAVREEWRNNPPDPPERKERREHPMDPTPRPWRIGPYPGHVENSASRLVAGCNGHTNNVRDETSTNHANAELIVAAVNNYSEAREAAFCKLISAATQVSHAWHYGPTTEEVNTAVVALREALKAVEDASK